MASKPASQQRRILFLTNVEHGEANVFLATAHALLQEDPDVELHFASFAGLEASVTSVWQQARLLVPTANPIIQHEIKGLRMGEGLLQYFVQRQIPRRDDYLPESIL